MFLSFGPPYHNPHLLEQLRQPFPAACFWYLRLGLQRPFWTGRLDLFQDARNGRSGDRESFGNLADALAVDALSQYRGVIDIERAAADVPALRRARRIPALTLSTISERSNSAMAEMITTTARPSGPPVSRFSRKLMYSMFSRFSSSSTSRK